MEKVIVLNYTVEFIYDKEDDIYIAKAVDLPGCITHGDTQEEAVDEMKIAIKEHLRTLKKLGKEIPQPWKIYA
jgi:predicted RNase H-like HicB family nuclease